MLHTFTFQIVESIQAMQTAFSYFLIIINLFFYNTYIKEGFIFFNKNREGRVISRANHFQKKGGLSS